MKISIIGAGYVGLVTGVCLAEKNHSVVCVDIDRERVRTIQEGEVPFYERGVEKLLKAHLGKNFYATGDLRQAVLDTDVTMITTGTPFREGAIDLKYIQSAAQSIGNALKDKDTYHLVVVKSTVVPETTDGLVKDVLEGTSRRTCPDDFGLGMNPEFLREGSAVEDFLSPDRIVIGGIDRRSQNLLEDIYADFKDVDQLTVNNRTAEMIKYVSNSFLAALISFSNEMANLCSAHENLDVEDVMRGLHLDRRLNPKTASGKRINPGVLSYLKAGCGYGGSCFPKDTKALAAQGRLKNVRMPLLRAVIQTNDHQPQKMLAILQQKFDTLKNLDVAVLGVSFKPDTDDIRESPAITLIHSLAEYGVRVKVHDPVALEQARTLFDASTVACVETLSECIEGVQAVLIITAWREFLQLHDLLEHQEQQPVIIDGRRMLDKKRFKKYAGIGLTS